MFNNLSPNVKGALITAGAAICLGLLGGIYKLGYDSGAKDYQTVDDFQKILPPMMQQLTRLAKDISDRDEMSEKIRTLSKQLLDSGQHIQRLEDRLKGQAQEMSGSRKRIEDLEAAILQLVPEKELKISVATGTSERVMSNALSVAVSNYYGSFVDGKINGQSTGSLRAGDRRSVRIGDRECIVELVKISNPSSDFVISCSKK